MKRALTRVFVVFAICILCAQQLCAQQQERISVNLQDATVNMLIADIESKSKYRFYYDNTLFNSVKITISVSQELVPAILEKALANTEVRFSIINGQVFLTKGAPLKLELASGYYERETVPVNNVIVPANDRTDIVANTENKRYEIGVKTNQLAGGEVKLEGYVRNARTGEPVKGAEIFVRDLNVTVVSDDNGYYSITMSRGMHDLTIKAFNIKETRRQVMLYSAGKLNIELQEQVFAVQEVTVSATKVANLRGMEMGLNRIDAKSLKQVPAVFGEADVVRVVLTLPGVQSVGEAGTGFNVRGGAVDQNLILLDDATIYNPSHFFGFFSAFNPDLVKDVELYKSSIPERFGGRLSAVLDVSNRDGNKDRFTGSAGLGLITSRLNIEGPIDSGKTSFIAGGRTTYSNWLLRMLPADYRDSKASFSDANLGISHQFNANNSIHLSGYFSTDDFSLNADTVYGFGNRNASIKWKSKFSNRFSGTFVVGIDRYEYNISSDANPVNAYKLNFDVNQLNGKADFVFAVNEKHTVNFGAAVTQYRLNPGINRPLGSESKLVPQIIAQEKARESSIYIGDKFDITDDLSVSAGLRYSYYQYLGPQTVNQYAPGLPRSEFNQTGTITYGNNEVIQPYHGPEIRVSARYSINDALSIKASYNSLRQYIHLLSNTTAIAPTDVYKLSDPNVKPQLGNQVSLGVYRNFNKNTIETSVEVYYKKIRDYLDFKSGANLVLNPTIETDILNTEGKAYGVEFFLKKTTGKLNGWISYAYSRTLLRVNDPLEITPINGGKYYPANYDKPSAFNFIGNYRVTQRYSFSLNAIFSTGRPITLPIAKYVYAGGERVHYSERNAYRIPNYFRTDVSMIIDGNHKVRQRFHNSWTFGVYNLTGNQNPYSVYFDSQGGTIQGYRLSIFAAAIPFVNYNVRF